MNITEDILKKATSGDMESFEVLYKATAKFVYNVALRIANNREDAEEVTQEVFLIIYHKLKAFRFESSFKTWVYRIAVNQALNHVKKKSQNRNETISYDDQFIAGTVAGDVEEDVEQEHHAAIVEKFLNAVNPDQRACVVLCNIEGLSYRETAESLGINVNTVRSRLKRAREKFLTLRKKVGYEQV